MSEETTPVGETVVNPEPQPETLDADAILDKVDKKFKGDKDKMAVSYYLLEQKFGEQGNELGKLRKEIEGMKTAEPPKAEEKKEEAPAEISQAVKDEIKKRFAHLPKTERDEFIANMTPDHWKALEAEVEEGMNNRTYVPDYMTDVVTAPPQTTVKTDDEVMKALREKIGIVAKEATEIPVSKASSVPKPATKYPDGGISFTNPKK